MLKSIYFTSILVSLFLSAAYASEMSCRSTESYAGCFVVSADINVNFIEGTFTMQKIYTPLCPQWPPYEQISGKIIYAVNEIQFLNEDDQKIGQLSERILQKGYYGKILDYSFLGCKMSEKTPLEAFPPNSLTCQSTCMEKNYDFWACHDECNMW